MPLDITKFLSDSEDEAPVDEAQVEEIVETVETAYNAEQLEEPLAGNSEEGKPSKADIFRKIHVMTFDDEEACRQYMNQLASENGFEEWSAERSEANGSTSFYCPRGGRGGRKRDNVTCYSRLFVRKPNDSNHVVLYSNFIEHTHSTQYRGLQPDVQEAVNEAYNICKITKPEDVMEYLRRKGFDDFAIRKSKVENYLRSLKKKSSGGGNSMVLQELFEICEPMKTIPQPDPESVNDDWMDQPFCIDVVGASSTSEQVWYLALFSTPRLISLHEHGRPCHTDGTYKLNWMNLPVIVVGTSDLHLHFHPTLIALSYSETKEDYKQVFESLKDGYERVTGL